MPSLKKHPTLGEMALFLSSTVLWRDCLPSQGERAGSVRKVSTAASTKSFWFVRLMASAALLVS